MGMVYDVPLIAGEKVSFPNTERSVNGATAGSRERRLCAIFSRYLCLYGHICYIIRKKNVNTFFYSKKDEIRIIHRERIFLPVPELQHCRR